MWYRVNSGPSEFGTKWTRDQVVNSGPNIFGTWWIRDQTLGEFGTNFFLSYKYINTGISYLVWVPSPTYFIAPLWYASLCWICVCFVYFFPWESVLFHLKSRVYHARYALVCTSFTNILWTYAVQRVGVCIRPRKKICVFTVRRPTLMFGPDPNLFYGTLSRNLFKHPILVFECSFWCLRDHYFDKNELIIPLQV